MTGNLLTEYLLTESGVSDVSAAFAHGSSLQASWWFSEDIFGCVLVRPRGAAFRGYTMRGSRAVGSLVGSQGGVSSAPPR